MTYNPADFSGVRSNWVSPDVVLIDAIESDTVDLPQPIRRIRATVAGNVKITTIAGTDVTIAILAGETRDIAIKRVWDTGTTATGLEGML